MHGREEEGEESSDVDVVDLPFHFLNAGRRDDDDTPVVLYYNSGTRSSARLAKVGTLLRTEEIFPNFPITYYYLPFRFLEKCSQLLEFGHFFSRNKSVSIPTYCTV